MDKRSTLTQSTKRVLVHNTREEWAVDEPWCSCFTVPPRARKSNLHGAEQTEVRTRTVLLRKKRQINVTDTQNQNLARHPRKSRSGFLVSESASFHVGVAVAHSSCDQKTKRRKRDELYTAGPSLGKFCHTGLFVQKQQTLHKRYEHSQGQGFLVSHVPH